MTPRGSYLFPVLVYAGFVLTGVVTTLLGPILPALAERWSLHDQEAGRLFTAQFLGSTAGVALSSVLLPRLGFRVLLVLGFAATSGGVLGLGAAVWTRGIAAIFCYGVGLGLTIPTTNLMVAQENRDRSAAALNVLNLTWGVGAVSWPYVARLTQGSPDAARFALAGSLALVAFSYGSIPMGSRGVAEPSPVGAPLDTPTPSSLGRNVLVFGLLFFLYVGTENALAGWVASHARRLGVDPAGGWMLMPSLFWGGLLGGRGVAPALLARVTETRLAVAGLLLAAAGTVALLGATSLGGVGTAVLLAGLGLASVFPIIIALMSKAFGARASRLAGWMFAAAGLGGATLPWLVGVLSTRFGSLRAGLMVPLAGCMAMVTLLLVIIRPLPPAQPALGARARA